MLQSLVLTPLPDFTSQLWKKNRSLSPQLQNKIWKWLRNKARYAHNVLVKALGAGSKIQSLLTVGCSPSSYLSNEIPWNMSCSLILRCLLQQFSHSSTAGLHVHAFL